MKKRLCLLIFLLVASVTACTDATSVSPTQSSEPTRAASADTATPDLITPETTGRNFLDAMIVSDYEGMYSLFSENARNSYTFEDFSNRLASALDTTTTYSITLVPETLTIDGNMAWIEFSQTLHTGVFGDLNAINRLPMDLDETGWWVDWSPSVFWPDLNDDARFDVQYQIPNRENIYDRNGAALAVRSTSVMVGIVPQEIESDTEPTLLANLSEILDMPVDEIQAKYAGQPANWYIEIGEVTPEVSLEYADWLALPGINLRERSGRAYPLDGVGAHVTGWVAPIPAETFTEYRMQGYRADQYVGISGLEAWGESYLAGRNGARLQIVSISEGNTTGTLMEVQAERGRALTTTLDRSLQQSSEQALGQRRGAVVAIDIHTGGILALTSGPTFDNNAFVRPHANDARQAILANPYLPLLNRALQGQYPPGSAFKIVTLSAALEASAYSAGSNFTCPGFWDGLGIGNRKLCWKDEGHGDLTLQQGLTASCNVVFYEVGLALDGMGQLILPTFGQAYGLGERTGLPELPEASGLMPTPKWKEDTYDQAWAAGDTVNMAIGQGYVLVTPLQLARMTAAVANGGTIYQPYIVSSVSENLTTAAQTFGPVSQSILPVSGTNLSILQEAMLGVTTDPLIGTATHRFAGLDILIAGKTGTAETGHEGDIPHSWFVGYFPADDPQIAMVVLVENAGEGSSVAAPMFRQVVEGFYGMPVTPLPDVIYTP